MGKSQCKRLLGHLKTYGSITSLDAWRQLGILRLAARIHDLKAMGVLIKTKPIQVKNRFDETCTIVNYKLVENDNDFNREDSNGS